jgi:hypothetical protein
MNRKSISIAAIALAAAAALAGSALAAPHGATLTIRHQVRGCHSWSFDNHRWAPTQKITLARGARLTVVDNDVMPHILVQLAGPKTHLASPAMTRMGDRAQVTFPAKGVYALGTKAGEDYPSMSAMKTVGEDNVLRLIVTVK